jgi:hypothetical protein
VLLVCPRTLGQRQQRRAAPASGPSIGCTVVRLNYCEHTILAARTPIEASTQCGQDDKHHGSIILERGYGATFGRAGDETRFSRQNRTCRR